MAFAESLELVAEASAMEQAQVKGWGAVTPRWGNNYSMILDSEKAFAKPWMPAPQWQCQLQGCSAADRFLATGTLMCIHHTSNVSRGSCQRSHGPVTRGWRWKFTLCVCVCARARRRRGRGCAGARGAMCGREAVANCIYVHGVLC